MDRNSVTGRFRDIEIVFSIDGDCIVMSVRNLTDSNRRVRVMYQKLSMSGLANWAQFELSDTPISRHLPTEIIDAYRLTFFVDNAEPVYARMEKILDELHTLKDEQPAEATLEDTAELGTSEAELQTPEAVDAAAPALKPLEDPTTKNDVTPLSVHSNTDEPTVSEVKATEDAEKTAVHPATKEPLNPISTPLETSSDKDVSTVPEIKRTGQVEERPASVPTKSVLPRVDANVEFKIEVPSLPPSTLAEQRKAEVAKLNAGDTKSKKGSSKRREKGVFGQFAQALGLTAGGRRGKVYYQERGEKIQNAFQDQLAKLERDYNEGYGLNLSNWDPETLCEAEIAILLLNLMVNEVIAWRKEIGRTTDATEQLVQALDEVDVRLRQTLKQTRGISTPSPTLFPDLLAENERDVEKIQSECDAYLQRFASKLTEQERKHASKIEVVIFKKFLIGFIRDFLFVEVTKSIKGAELPERLEWFLDLVDSEVIPIEVGVTRVSQNHHRVKGARACDFEPGTVVEVVSHGLQSKDGRRVSQMAVVIEAE
ncbi:hypothetical protein F4Y93_10355 [Candidatus Poribacteria bacterium]|nr:hypothetical protein [Candidatus Poribacteria bacterium]